MPPHLDALDRQALATLGREWLLHGHLQDRVGMALLLEVADRQTMQDIAIEEWAAASPIYSRRMQRALNFVGSDVSTIMKCLQLDIGAPHQFMDFRYRLVDPEHGEFWLAHCGALMDVEPMGKDFVVGMCHAIEDPTFDATAAATNPLAQVRPLHRPPRVPAGRTPMCHWRIDVVADAPVVPPTPLEDLLQDSHLANLDIPTHEARGDGGWPDYSGPFDPDFCLEDLSRSALLVALDEFALQSHLLLRGFLTSAAQRFGAQVAADLLPRLVAGWCSLTSQRLSAAFSLGSSIPDLARLLDLHPMLAPRAYTGVRVQFDDKSIRVSFGDCPAGRDHDGGTWWGSAGMTQILTAVVQSVQPQASLRKTGPVDDEIWAFIIDIDPAAEPAPAVPELAVAKVSTGAAFRFTQRRPVRT